MNRRTASSGLSTIESFDDLENPLDPAPFAQRPDIDGDHPDPITLSEPAYDDQGLLRWSSLPPQRP
jgi:hypothetical protein